VNLKIHQIIEALDYGDAVSNHAIDLSKQLTELGFQNSIYSKYVHEKVNNFRLPIEELQTEKDDVLLFHFSGKTSMFDVIRKQKCKKILLYHNITPHYFFQGMEPHYTHCFEGRKQLKEIAGLFDMYLGDSEYNVKELEQVGCSQTRVLPISVDLKIKGDRKQYTIKKKGRKFLFVGRVAPNKKHEDIMRIFEYYYQYIDRDSTLYFVGNYQDYLPYYNKLVSYKNTLQSSDKIIFTGKVSSEEVHYHYSTADVFICMSEHEGFCVPLLESMSYGIPTFAYDSGAIRSTMQNAGVIITKKMHEEIAELVDVILNDTQLTQEIIDQQYEHLSFFSREKALKNLEQIIQEVRSM
jgi:glycosyltransferase involved in cell wall biosynthesis